MSTPQPPQQPQQPPTGPNSQHVVYVERPKAPWYKRPGCLIPLILVILMFFGFVGCTALLGKSLDDAGLLDETTSSSAPAAVKPAEGDAPAEPAADAPAAGDSDVPREYKNALKAAQNYLKFTPFSKAGLYDQLTSEYANKFPADAAQYAVDNVQTDWNENALKTARRYQEISHMSDAELYDQLISEYADQYTPEQAQYAIDNL
ncbi:Ltp family lipoprotein [Corynebacterium sp. P5875]|uniref:Ltp family lipoprotein n=1 Tax=Corynebacterium antarcticum TaxID=2800405 RepID=A0A9Q4CAU8_9CORY|nr:Ltp family lipoprotein [Corynebacterium antarcticum]MCX7537073.1 Ltp family lipoprotein [Corynebacterium antarcticum]